MNSLIIAANLTKRTIGHWRGILLYILIPALAVSLIIGLIGAGGDRPVPISYYNADSGAAGAHIVRELSRNPRYKLIESQGPEAMKRSVLERKASAAFLIPADFTASLRTGEPSQLEHYDVALSEASFTLRIALQQGAERIKAGVDALKASGAGEGALELMLQEAEQHRIGWTMTDYGWYENPALRLSTGIMILFIMAIIGHSVSVIVEDRRQHTMTRMYAAPVRAFEIALGNMMGSFLVGTLQILIMLSFTRYVLGFDYGLPFGPHFLVMECFLLAVMGIASAVAGLVRSRENIAALNSIVSTPMCMLGGCFWPVSVMPEYMQRLSSFVPQSWAIDAVKRLATGQHLADLTLHFGVLLLFAIVLLGFGAAILRPASQESA
ncbi:ABC transporter permease [Paenibacillus filicis]|uniref:ABC transporter permease n=1 Tax=Paenibacillus filicis TaxID=669464 RepID=A0ABU9DNR7_9BACL